MARHPPTRDEIRAKHPRFWPAVVADARVACAWRGEREEFRNGFDAAAQVVRLMCVTDAFLGQVLYRAKAALQARHVPVLPLVAHRLAMLTAALCIGDLVVVQPGVYLTHGGVVIASVVEIRRGTVIGAEVAIGVRNASWEGPKVGADVYIGPGARLLGPVRVGDGARIDPNTLVIRDVPAHATVSGNPGRVVEQQPA
jgi:serine O-acetyltransferase